jgi:hypothetical protein
MTDTIRFKFSKYHEDFSLQETSNFISMVAEKAETFITIDDFQGIDITFWNFSGNLFVQALVFNNDVTNTFTVSRNYCDYDITENWEWGNIGNCCGCDNPAGLALFKEKFNNFCYINQQSLWCETGNQNNNVAMAYRLTPVPKNQSEADYTTIDELPCINFDDCEQNKGKYSSYTPIECPGSDYCIYFENSTGSYPYDLFYKPGGVPFSGCISGTDMNFYQESFAEFVLAVNDNLYGLSTYYWNVFTGYFGVNFQFSENGERLWEAKVIYRRCAPSFE